MEECISVNSGCLGDTEDCIPVQSNQREIRPFSVAHRCGFVGFFLLFGQQSVDIHLKLGELFSPFLIALVKVSL